MTTNLSVIAKAKQLRTDGSFRILLPFFRTSWGVGVLNSAIFDSFHNRVEFGTILEGLQNFGGLNTPNPPPRYDNAPTCICVCVCVVKRFQYTASGLVDSIFSRYPFPQSKLFWDSVK